ncbi:MAG: TonB-dependent receptor plug domain-containing protein, partial [Xanthobacteraceae bacterium]|nr:TonB-dependent receptor plug domain-containing protein [Xanthobacteraceae bacterium]
MNETTPFRRALAVGVSAAALIIAAPALAQTAAPPPTSTQGTTVGEIVVTAERRSESLQSTPIAVSAFTAQALKTQRLDGGQNLETSIPNVNYSRSNFGGYNFQIRGVGSKVVGEGGTSGVSFNVNELPVAANHFGDTDFYDVERVEVLRGPQGTLYGRNATGGAVNVITNKPTDTFSGSITGEYGNYNERKVTGYLN